MLRALTSARAERNRADGEAAGSYDPPANGFGVYVHVPFCSRRCDYCAFATWDDRHHLWERYVAAARAEAVSAGGALWKGRGPATSVFFGGGTPSLLPAELLIGALYAVKANLGVAPGAKVTVECNPETVTRQKLTAYRDAGVTRLSFGVQSMVPAVLASLGRQHDPAAVRRAAQLAGEEGFASSYSVDLIFGAAGETMSDWESCLDEVLALEPPPSHVSAYALTVEPGTPLSRRPQRWPDEDDQAEKYMRADEVLSGHGLEWYEISNWARPGRRCAHNLLYWAQGEYVGLGCAAHSHQVGPGGRSRRWWNVRTPQRYCRLVEDGSSPEAAGEELGPEEQEFEALTLSLRTYRGVPPWAVPEELFEQGLVELKPGSLSAGGGARAVLTRRGRLLANEVASRLAAPAVAVAGRGRSRRA